MSDRWVLSRAGILNVYQYGDEVMHFGDGRLLLRGVNGSGKSTAMNMLLPFLIDADTRRIDAAGVQQGVLRSWMLAGRDEPQPVGYLWLEMSRGDEHLVFGCGIRANRSTENVSTWWFVTDRRPHIDLNLLDGRTPRSIDSLREVLGPRSSVFTQDQRGAYRAELRARLYGGADLDQHIRLLHVLRNPTVGDRIDTELERYLDEALPQLSEPAIDDAAQPLEDLEEHRTNVAQLTATDDAMRALAATYSSYARGELRAAAEQAQAEVDGVTSLRRRHDRLARDAQRTAIATSDARDAVGVTEGEITRLQAEIKAFEDQPLYQEGKALDDLRELVRTLAEAVTRAEARLRETAKRRDDELEEHDRAASTVRNDHSAATTELSELRAALALHHVDATVGDLPPIEVGDAAAPPTRMGSALAAGLGTATIALALRASEVDIVRQGIQAVEEAMHALALSEAGVLRARKELSEATEQLAGREAASAAAVSAFRAALAHWIDDATTFAETDDDVVPPPALADDVDVRGERVELRDRSAAWVVTVQRRIDQEIARAEELAGAAATVENEARATLRELLDRTEPDPPSLAWQSDADRPRLAALVDFRDEVGPDDRLGLEAALEASGLLAATIRGARLQLANGDLVAISGPAVARPLSDLLVVTLPQPSADGVDIGRVRAVLDAISVDVDGDAPNAVAADGRFRIGSLTGRHRRDRLELIGVTARQAALERQRDEARAALATAELDHTSTRSEVTRWAERRDGAVALADQLPPTDPVDRALLAEEAAIDLVGHRADALGALEDGAARAERERDGRDDALRSESASLRLPRTEPELRTVEKDLNHAGEQVGRVRSALATLDRSLDAWVVAGGRFATARADVDRAEEACRVARAEHEPRAARLATLEDALSADYQLLLDALAVSRADLDAAEKGLPSARKLVEVRVEANARAEADAELASQAAESAESQVVDHLDRLRAVLAVPGLSLAAWSTDWDVADDGEPRSGRGGADEALPVAPAVERSSGGVSTLARWIETQTPAPGHGVNAESVRMSLRQRRNTLGAGWDAEDRQPDATLPVSVEVNGPEGRFPLAEAARVVNDRLHQQRSLLDAKQTQALRNLLQGLIAKEIAAKLGAARDLVALMNHRLAPVETAHGIRVSLQWRRRDDLDEQVRTMIDLLAKPPDLRTAEDDELLIEQISRRIDDARADQPEAPYRDLIATVLDYRHWHQMRLMLHRPDQAPQRLGRRTPLSEGEKKVVSYLPLFAAVAASCDALAEHEPSAPRFVLLDDAFAKVSVDNHEQLFGLLVEMDLDFIATSERLWGTHASVPELAITEVIRDAVAGVILLEHAHWNGTAVETGRDG